MITLHVRIECEHVIVSPANQMASVHCGYLCTLEIRVSQSRQQTSSLHFDNSTLIHCNLQPQVVRNLSPHYSLFTYYNW